MDEQVVLVNEQDNQIGLMDKLEAHRGEGRLHRAISVLLYREGKGGQEVLLQKRAASKPLWPLFWTNTVCTHPRDGESRIACAVRRLPEEMGISVKENELKLLYKFTYQARYNAMYSEHELDGVVIGKWDGVPQLNPDEAVDWKWVNWQELKNDLQRHPNSYTPWFRLVMENERLDDIFKESQ